MVSTVDAAAAQMRPGDRRLRILLLADDAHPADAVRDHIRSIKQHSRQRVAVVNPIRYRKGWRVRSLDYDVILIHYSISVLFDYYLPGPVAAAVAAFSGPKIQIIQDECRWVDRMTQRMAGLGINAVFSSLTPENIRLAYHHQHVAGIRFISGLPGYISNRLRKVDAPPLANRPFDLVYRGRPLPIWLGRFGQEKAAIGEQALRMAERYDLKADCDTREEARVYGAQWHDLLTRGRAALATEGGATVFDFDGTIEEKVAEYRNDHPAADDDDVWHAVVRPHEGNVVHKTITPRVFEAIMCRTALVMYPGDYRGILQPWEHYIPLERDGSNEAEVVSRLRDDAFLEQLTERAYRRVADDPALDFANYVRALDAAASRLFTEREAAAQGHRTAFAGLAALPVVRNCISGLERQLSDLGNVHTPAGKASYKISQWTELAKTLLVRLLSGRNTTSSSGGGKPGE
ncbi:glycosyltransferase [Pelagibius marinus]|uniref:glycosyltransferase n=1 Tax=Pelagibius marinus TaxID=2762760 RepID=UPI00187216AC|nr:glycosyltransferase [Pelagibius marinus]